MDKYQKRYKAHQMRKKKVLVKMIKQRHSTRVFADKEVKHKDIVGILNTLLLCPSSCDRLDDEREATVVRIPEGREYLPAYTKKYIFSVPGKYFRKEGDETGSSDTSV